jgi:hypothetical protein
MFKLAHHNTILTILKNLDSDVLKKSSAYFGGGTLLSLDFEEYRWSKDIDFVCPVLSQGYSHLRSTIFDNGHEALFHDLNSIQIRSRTTDQYGIRMLKAYEVIRPLKVAIQRFQDRENYRERFFLSLQIEDYHIPRIIDGIDLLAGNFGLPMTQRVYKEQHSFF